MRFLDSLVGITRLDHQQNTDIKTNISDTKLSVKLKIAKIIGLNTHTKEAKQNTKVDTRSWTFEDER
jgi:hypothetical protein